MENSETPRTLKDEDQDDQSRFDPSSAIAPQESDPRDGHRYVSMHFNGLRPDQAERLAWLLEELGEAQQIIGKILRHGFDSVNPTVENGPTNRQALERELGDVEAAIQMLGEYFDINLVSVSVRNLEKTVSVLRWMHHQFPAPPPSQATE